MKVRLFGRRRARFAAAATEEARASSGGLVGEPEDMVAERHPPTPPLEFAAAAGVRPPASGVTQEGERRVDPAPVPAAGSPAGHSPPPASGKASAPNGSVADDEDGGPGGARPSVRFSGMKTFAVANQKGGVGKTTTAVNVAACIAEAGYPTLLIDIDPQANATVGIGAARDLAPSVYDVLAGTCAAGDAVHPTGVDGLYLMPAGVGLAGANVELPRVAGSETLLREALAALGDRFAFVLLDCPPSLGPLTVNALVAADRLIVPVQTEYYALEGLAALLDTVKLVQGDLNPRLRVAGMLLTMHDSRTRLGRDVANEVRQHFPELVYDTVIPRNVRIGEAPSFGVPITVHAPRCAGSDAYVALAKEVAARA
ncbi:MAG: chromosome partitioning protein [Solirubrobacteraceae bacterium]|nr:chromosome partitioning protein [Solirubrobacteraceae bacterium]